MSKFKVGDRVTPKITKEAYGSCYAGSPKVEVGPGMVGIVAVVDVPAVRHCKGRPQVFNCVDFVIEGQHAFNLPRNPPIWRVALYDDEMTPTLELPDVRPLHEYPINATVRSFLDLLGTH